MEPHNLSIGQSGDLGALMVAWPGYSEVIILLVLSKTRLIGDRGTKYRLVASQLPGYRVISHTPLPS